MDTALQSCTLELEKIAGLTGGLKWVRSPLKSSMARDALVGAGGGAAVGGATGAVAGGDVKSTVLGATAGAGVGAAAGVGVNRLATKAVSAHGKRRTQMVATRALKDQTDRVGGNVGTAKKQLAGRHGDKLRSKAQEVVAGSPEYKHAYPQYPGLSAFLSKNYSAA